MKIEYNCICKVFVSEIKIPSKFISMFLNDNIYQVRLKQNLLQWLKLYNLNVMGHITNNTVPGLITYKHFFYYILLNSTPLV